MARHCKLAQYFCHYSRSNTIDYKARLAKCIIKLLLRLAIQTKLDTSRVSIKAFKAAYSVTMNIFRKKIFSF